MSVRLPLRAMIAPICRTATRHYNRPFCTVGKMCRNITMLRGLEPPATAEEIDAAALQYVRKVSGVRAPSAGAEAEFDQAVRAVAQATAQLLAALPPRRQPPPTLPPLRRLAYPRSGTSTP